MCDDLRLFLIEVVYAYALLCTIIAKNRQNNHQSIDQEKDDKSLGGLDVDIWPMRIGEKVYVLGYCQDHTLLPN